MESSGDLLSPGECFHGDITLGLCDRDSGGVEKVMGTTSLSENGGKGVILDSNSVHDRMENDREEDEAEWVVGDEGDEGESAKLALSLVGKIWSMRVPNPSAFMATMKGIWMVRHGLDISHIGKNLFLMQFFHWRDKQKILDGQPWHFDKYSLLLAELDGVVKPSDVTLFHLPVWARFYDIPFKGRGRIENAKMLGNKVGVFLEAYKSDRESFDNP